MRPSHLASAALLAASPVLAQENVLVVVADDLGVDQLAVYGVGADLPFTPNLDLIASRSVVFRNAWTAPVCSPTRASLFTGRYGFRTGVGNNVGGSTGLPLSEVTLPELLDQESAGYAHAIVGKWHLGSSPAFGGLLSPNAAGWSHFAGSMGNLNGAQSYDTWIEVVDGVAATRTEYPTTVTVDRALEWIQTAPEPWLCVVSFNAPHSPFHRPPDSLVPGLPQDGDPRAFARPYYKAMTEALDVEFGRLIAGLGPAFPNTTLIFAGDNGSPKAVTVPPFEPEHAKLTVYEGGVRVPLMISGPRVVGPGRDVDHVVHLVDLFASIARIAGVDAHAALPSVTLDSVDLLPYLQNPLQAPLRTTVYSELFQPLAVGPHTLDLRVIRDERFKLLRRVAPAGAEELYDLVADPFEEHDLLLQQPLPPSAQLAYDALTLELDSLNP